MDLAGSCVSRASPGGVPALTQPVGGVVVGSAMCLCTFLGKSTLPCELCAAAHRGGEAMRSHWKLDVRWASHSSAYQIRDSHRPSKPSGAKFRLFSAFLRNVQ